MTIDETDEEKSMSQYDSMPQTAYHIRDVRILMKEIANTLIRNAYRHDNSKLSGIEKECLDKAGAQERVEDQSEARKARMAILRPMIEHHYAHNSHHPEHYPDGVNGMDLLDLIEMLCDWKAAADERDTEGFNIDRSLANAPERWDLQPQLATILRNTAMRCWPNSVQPPTAEGETT
jgi:hypothetical protein